MLETLRFLGKYEILIYLLLSLAGIYSFRWLFKAWREWRAAYFGLEREIALRRLTQAASASALVAILMCGVFSAATFLLPRLPVESPLATPTLDLFATPSGALPPDQAALLAGAPAAPIADAQGCIPGRLEITFPRAGDEISQTVTLIGTVNLPNFGFYKYEVSLRGAETWTTISAQSRVKNNEDLGSLNPAMFTPGDYLLRIVVLDNDKQEIGTCAIPIRIKGQ